MDRSAVGTKVSMSVAELFDADGSTMPAAGAEVAVLLTVPVALGLIAVVIANVAVVPAGRLTVVLIEPLPEADVQPAPALGVHVHEVKAAPAGWVSVNVVAGALDGPPLLTVTVYVVDCPGITEATPSVLVTARSARGVSVSTSVAELFAAFVSVTPSGAETAAVLLSVPVAPAAMAVVTVKVAEAPTGRSTLLLIDPLPDAGHTAPPVVAHVHVIVDTPAGIASVTDAPSTLAGPELVTTTVYVVDWPGTAVEVPSVLLMVRSVCGVTTVTSVAELLAGVGSVIEPGSVIAAVLVMVPVAEALTVAEMENVAVPPGTSVTDADTLPLPDAGQEDPALAEQVQVAPESAAGTMSPTVAPVTVEGPGFEATTVYVTSVPGTTVLRPSVLVIDTSAVGVRVSMSLAELLADTGSVTPAGACTVAVLVSDPVAVGETATTTVYVTDAAVARVAVVEIGIEPDAVPQLAPAVAAHVQVPDVAPVGSASTIGAFTAVDGPALATTTV